MGSWNMQEHWDSDLFCFGGGRICGGFPPLLRFGVERPDLPLFLLHLRTAFFEAHLLSPWKIWQLWTLESYKVLMETPDDCYTLVDMFVCFVCLRHSHTQVYEHLRVEFLLKTESGYLRDAEVT